MTQSPSQVLEILGTYLHLRPLKRVVLLLPVVPGHSFRVILTIDHEVQTIQIGPVTIVVPPAAFITQGTVTTVPVTIAILGSK